MTPLFRSFWHAGFEAACHINRAGVRLDMLAATQHDVQAADDYRNLADFGIRTVRESMRWHRIDQGGHYDFTSCMPLIDAARQQDIQVIWSLCHFGWPDDLALLSPAFVDRFARYCGAATRRLVESGDTAPIIAPMNEISFLAWAVGEDAYIHPAALGKAGEVKKQLIRATLAGIAAVRDAAPAARIVHIDPLLHVVCPTEHPALARQAELYRERQFEAIEMLRGRLAPELGGAPGSVDIIGVNFYHANQSELAGDRLRWEDEPRDARWRPLRALLQEMWQRFERPVYLAETSHFGAGRARWILEIAAEVAAALEAGVPVEGVCLYPIIDRPDWEATDHWHHSGLWDLRRAADGRLERVLCADYAAAVRQAQAIVASRRTPAEAFEPQMAGSRP